MTKSLLDVIFSSEKRKRVLMILHDGPKGTPFMLSSLNTTRPALLPQLRLMEKHNLISHSNDKYELTRIGKLLSNEAKPLIETIETLDKGSTYFLNHNIDGIPEHFLKRIREIKDFVLLEPDHVASQQLNADYLKDCLASEAVYFVYTFMHPTCIPVLQQLVDNNIYVENIMSEELVNKIITDMPDKCHYFLSFDNLKIYSYSKKIGICTLTVTDSGFLLRLLFRNNEFSNKQIICTSPEGRKWGKDLYDFYAKDAKLITKV